MGFRPTLPGCARQAEWARAVGRAHPVREDHRLPRTGLLRKLRARSAADGAARRRGLRTALHGAARAGRSACEARRIFARSPRSARSNAEREIMLVGADGRASRSIRAAGIRSAGNSQNEIDLVRLRWSCGAGVALQQAAFARMVAAAGCRWRRFGLRAAPRRPCSAASAGGAVSGVST